MQISRELDYALRSILALSTHQGEILPKRMISEEYDVPINFLAIILPKLVHCEMIESIPGPRGGYRLKKLPCQISIFDVIMAIDKGFTLNKCFEENASCRLMDGCPIRPHIKAVADSAKSYFGNITFESMISGKN